MAMDIDLDKLETIIRRVVDDCIARGRHSYPSPACELAYSKVLASIDTRLNAIEAKLAAMERTLDKVTTEQQHNDQRLQVLERLLEKMSEKVEPLPAADKAIALRMDEHAARLANLDNYTSGLRTGIKVVWGILAFVVGRLVWEILTKVMWP